MMLTFTQLADMIVVYRDGAWLGTIEEWDGEGRYVHAPDRQKTFNSLRTEEMFEIANRMQVFDT